DRPVERFGSWLYELILFDGWLPRQARVLASRFHRSEVGCRVSRCRSCGHADACGILISLETTWLFTPPFSVCDRFFRRVRLLCLVCAPDVCRLPQIFQLALLCLEVTTVLLIARL